jgi:hypothetical protein
VITWYRVPVTWPQSTWMAASASPEACVLVVPGIPQTEVGELLVPRSLRPV